MARPLAILAVLVLGCSPYSCGREDPAAAVTVTTGQFGDPGSGYTVQCSGWYPDWIVKTTNAPGEGAKTFQLSQGYWLGTPVLTETDAGVEVTGWEAPSPVTGGPGAPWLDVDPKSDPTSYMNALKAYLLEGMVEVEFEARRNAKRAWYHAPLMSNREPYHGLTPERRLRSAEHSWILNNGTLGSYGIGYFNKLASYTLGQVYHNIDPTLADPTKAKFPVGSFIFKQLFAEYRLASGGSVGIDPSQDPLEGSPAWTILDAGTDTIPARMVEVRLLQVDVAVRDDRATGGWIYATFVYDKSHADASGWARLAPVGLQWGNDPDVVTDADVALLDETWTSGAWPAVYGTSFGRHGRLNGPVDNPSSSCLSCHLTAQVDPDDDGNGERDEFLGVEAVGAHPARIPPPTCTNAQQMMWFRNLAGYEPFGNQAGCVVDTSVDAGLVSLDSNLQLAIGLTSALFYKNDNPCAGLVVDGDSVAVPGEDEAGSGEAKESFTTKAAFRSPLVAPELRTVAWRRNLATRDPGDFGLGVSEPPQR